MVTLNILKRRRADETTLRLLPSLAPMSFLTAEEGGVIDFDHSSENLHNSPLRLRRCIATAKERRGLWVSVMKCRRDEAEKVGAMPGLTWRLEISYPKEDPCYLCSIPPTDGGLISVAKTALPSHPACHRPHQIKGGRGHI